MIPGIAILGDYNPGFSTHRSLNDSVDHAASVFTQKIQFDWRGSDTFSRTELHTAYSGLWIAPGSPYRDTQNVLDTITYAREHNIPVFGNCGGFQHMLIEFASNVCGISGAAHEETNPDAAEPVICRLSCSLIAREEQVGLCDKQSILFDILKEETLTGKYFCNYGLNSKYTESLKAHGLTITGVSLTGQLRGQVRAFELKTHPFFVGTLFQPALSSTAGRPNPLIVAFIQECLKRQDRNTGDQILSKGHCL